jgi:hypothetical protein
VAGDSTVSLATLPDRSQLRRARPPGERLDPARLR